MASVRPYRGGDRPAVYDICIRTAHLGGDARPVYRDPDLLPEIFAGPYLHLDPHLAFVLADDADHPVGYVIGTGDTSRFVKRFASEWLPLVSDRYPPLDRPPANPDEVMLHLLHTPERMLVPEMAAYPAHLHIDILPGYQRSGYGRQLMNALLDAMRADGVPAVHLGMVTENRAARPFYDRLGFHVIDVPDPGPLTYLGLRL